MMYAPQIFSRLEVRTSFTLRCSWKAPFFQASLHGNSVLALPGNLLVAAVRNHLQARKQLQQ
jgi:hypothetical protein